MSRAGIRIGIGTRFVYDGEVVEIIEMHTVGASLEVLAKDARALIVRRFGLEELLFSDRARILTDTTEGHAGDRADVSGVVLSCLTAELRKAVSEKANHIREVLTGYRSGHPQVALPGEPRLQYSPDLPLGQRYAAKAAEIGKGYRTIEGWVKAYRSDGEAGLVPNRAVRSGVGSRVDSRWTETALEVMVEHADMSRPTGAFVINHSTARLIARNGEGAVRLPSKATAYRALGSLDAKYPTFRQSRKRNRDVAARSTEEYGKLRPTRPGEYMLMDTTRLDVFAMDPLTLRWVGVDLTVAMDWYTRCITGLRLTPMSTKAIDAAAVLYQTFRPPAAGRNWPTTAVWPYHGLPRSVLVDPEVWEREGPAAAGPAIVPDTLIVDHGKIFVSHHLNSVCERLGVSIQPARVGIARDKGPVERFFRTLREGLLAELPGYKGPDVYSRGIAPEREAFFFVDELEDIIREWIAVVYHRRVHKGLYDPGLPSLRLSPSQMFEHGVARAGYIEAPRDPNLAYQFLDVQWRTIQHFGVEIDKRYYRGSGLPAVGAPSRYRNKGKTWPFHVDPDDITRIYFHNRKTNEWQPLIWDQAEGLKAPMNEDGLHLARRLARSKFRHFDDRLAMTELLERRKLYQGNTMAERRIALRLSREQSNLAADLAAASDVSQLQALSSASTADVPGDPVENAHARTVDDLDVPPADFNDDFYVDSLEEI